MKYQLQINELCTSNIQCKNEVCNLLHPRCFAGVCILHLQKKQDDCNDTLLHMTNKEFKAYFSAEKINGVFYFNLCKKQNFCQDKQNCRFLHRKWAENFCMEELLDECKNKQECKLQHDTWQQIRKQAYTQFNIHDLNPEEIENSKQHKLPNDICIDYLNGLCQFQTSCSKNHVDWECLKNSNYKDIKDTRRRQCFYDQSTLLIEQSSKFMNQENINQYFEKIQNIQIKKLVKKAQVIDVLFIIDNTGSMQRWLKSAKESINQIINEFQTQLDKKKNIVRTAIVAYRDYDDDDNLLYREFTTEHKIILDFLKKLSAKGGGDDPENVMGALEKGIRLNISKDADSVLCTFLICDSPSHGPYHEFPIDDHFDKVKEGDLENVMQRYYNLKDKNFFTCFKITETTNLMFKKMKTAFPDLIITETTPDHFHESVLFSLRTSLIQSETKTSKSRKTIKIRAKFSKSKPLEMNNSLLRDNHIDYWQNFLEQQEQNKIEGDTLLIINTTQEILQEKDKGSVCSIFKLFDVVLNRNLVLKLPFFVLNCYNQKRNLSQEDLKQYQEFIKIRYTSLLIAQQLAEGFRLKTLSIKGAPPIFYVSPIIYELEEPYMGVTQIFAETYIDLPNFSEWKKYTNNTRYADQDEYYYTAFSHYSYVVTDEKLIITDLQGKNNILSDPTIHTIDYKIRNILSDNSNFEKDGLIYFFEQQHPKCHEICQKLNLKKYTFSQNLSQNISDKQEDPRNALIWQRDPLDVICVICQVCGEFKDLQYQDYLKENSCICNNCLEDQDPIQLICTCCRKQFKCFFNQEVKIGKIPDKCDQCKLKCVKGNLECQYCGCFCEKRVNKLKIQDQEVTICTEGIRFLNALTCNKCKQLYKFETYIQPNDYQYSIYLCPKCKQQ